MRRTQIPPSIFALPLSVRVGSSLVCGLEPMALPTYLPKSLLAGRTSPSKRKSSRRNSSDGAEGRRPIRLNMKRVLWRGGRSPDGAVRYCKTIEVTIASTCRGRWVRWRNERMCESSKCNIDIECVGTYVVVQCVEGVMGLPREEEERGSVPHMPTPRWTRSAAIPFATIINHELWTG